MKKVLSILRTFEGYDDSFFHSYLKVLSYNNVIELVNFDDTTFSEFQTGSTKSRIARRLIRSDQNTHLNVTIKKYIKTFRPDIVIFFKASFLTSATIEAAKENGAQIFAIYPDLEPRVHGDDYLKVLKLSDYLIHTKPNLVEYFKSLNQNTICVNPFYSEKNVKVIEDYDKNLGISFIGHYSPVKKRSIDLISSSIDEKLTIFGAGWSGNTAKKNNLQIHNSIFGPPVYQIYKKSLFMLGLLTEKLNGFTEGDVITARTVQIPAYGGLILNPRNSFSETFFGESHFMLYKDIKDVKRIYRTISNNLCLREKLFYEQQSNALKMGTSIEKLLNSMIYNEKPDINNLNISI